MPADRSPSREAAYPRSRVIAAFAAVYVIWGSTYLAIRYAVQTIPPFILGGTRFLVAGTVLYVLGRASGERPTRRHWRDAFLAGGVLMLFGGNGTVLWAEQRVPSGITALIVAGVPLWMVVLDWLRPGGERPRGAVVLGIAVGVAGIVLLIGPGKLSTGEPLDLLGAAILIIGSAAWAAGSLLNRYGEHPRSAQLATSLQMLTGAAVFAVAALANGELSAFRPGNVSAASAIAWLYLATLAGIVGFTAYIYLLRAVSPAKASTHAYVNPVVAVFLGWAIAGEPVTPRTLVAAAVILAGVALITATQPDEAPSP
jgi:drug/metabolite transporter (DMT)-like permease